MNSTLIIGLLQAVVNFEYILNRPSYQPRIVSVMKCLSKLLL